jgi:hypothetical protein
VSKKNKILQKNELQKRLNTSNKPIAIESAAPVDRNGRLPCCTGHGSR